MLRRALLGSAVAATGGGAVVAYKHENDEGFRRAVALYSRALPAVAHYRFVQAKHRVLGENLSDAERQEEWLALDLQYSEGIVEMIKDLKGMYTKYGQIGAGLRGTLSDVWLEKLRELEDSVPPQPIDIVRKTIEEDFQKPMSEVFSAFEEVPLGSASIGQVHRAKIKGKEAEEGWVAVKVQYPDSRKLFRQDMKTIRGFMEIAAPEQVIILDELERSFEREFDYNCEFENLTRIAENLRDADFADEIRVPKPITATTRVLVMEYLKGQKLIDGIREYGKIIAASEGKTLQELEDELKEQIMQKGLPSRYEGPSETTIALYSGALRLRDAVANTFITGWNAVSGSHVETWHTPRPPNAPRIMDVLMRVHGKQLLVDGCFNADPHSGNFLWLEDDRIGLIDFGATKVLSREERLAACVLYAALYKEDRRKLIDMVRVSGYRSKHFDQDVIYDLVRFGYDDFSQDVLQGKNLQTFMDDLYARDPWQEAPDNLTMAQFLSIRLRGVGLGMLFPVKCSAYWGELALQVLKDEGLPYEAWDENLMNQVFGKKLNLAKGSARTSWFG